MTKRRRPKPKRKVVKPDVAFKRRRSLADEQAATAAVQEREPWWERNLEQRRKG